MNYKTLLLFPGFLILGFSSVLLAQESAEVEEKVIPTEMSEPPYELGDLCSEQGYYIDRGEDQTQINFRLVGNKPKVYWIDEDGLIAEPEAKSGSLRIWGAGFDGRPYYNFESIDDGVGLGSEKILPPPHIFNAVLVLEDESGKLDTHSFHYTVKLDKAVDPTEKTDEK